MIKIAIYGAGGFGREVRAWLERARDMQGIKFAGFLDDEPARNSANAAAIDDVVVAIADPQARKRIVGSLTGRQHVFARIIHPDVHLNDSVRIGRGSIVCSGVKITTDVALGDFVIVNLNTVVGHDVTMEAFVSVMPSANILGGVKLCEGAFVGAGATILQNLVIGAGSVVGAGAVVTHDVPPGKKVMGVPAREV